MTTCRRFAGAVGLVAAVLTGAACTQTRVEDPEKGLTFFAAPKKTLVHGSLWDPEAFHFSWLTCPPAPQSCPAGDDPFTDLSTGHFRRSLVKGANVSLWDAAAGEEQGHAMAPSTDYGAWSAARVLSREDKSFYYPVVRPGEQVELVDPPPSEEVWAPSPPMDPALPAANYLPTFNLRPIPTSQSRCYVPRIAVASDAGVLEAVAKYLTAQGKPTVVADFTDPSKYGGVAVWWLFRPGWWIFAIPADSTRMTSDVGETFQLSWARPGDPSVTEDVAAILSRRGFYVRAEDDASAPSYGVSVTLLPAASGATRVSFQAVDDHVNPEDLRPWRFDPMGVDIQPGLVSVGALYAWPSEGKTFHYAGFPLTLDPPESWRCVPDQRGIE